MCDPFPLRPWLSSVVMLLVLGVAGCMDHTRPNRDRPGGPLYQKWQGSGDRILVQRPNDGETVVKLRRRSDRYKIYDETLAPIGFVHLPEPRPDTAPPDAGGEGSLAHLPEVTSIDGETTARLERKSRSVYEYPGQFRLERTSRGWVLFGPDAEWSGRLVPTDGIWRLERRSSNETWRVVDTPEGAQLRAGERTLLEVQVGSIPPALLMALGIERLKLPARVSLGHLLDRMADDQDGGAAEGTGTDDPT